MKWREVPKEEAHRLFYPLIPVVVSSRVGEETGALLAISCTVLSFDPLRVGVALSPKSRTHTLVMRSGAFALNWLSAEHLEPMAYLGFSKGVRDKIAEAGLTSRRGRVLDVPVIEQAVAAMECKVRDRIEVGDHDLFLSDVMAQYAIEDFQHYWRFEEYTPLLYIGQEEEPRKRFLPFKPREGP